MGKKYSINRQNTPKFLELLSEKILLTGKYLNSIFETGTFIVKDLSTNEPIDENNAIMNKDQIKFHKTTKKLILPNAAEINFTTKEEIYKQIVENAYNYSSKILLNLLLKEHKLFDRLRSLKHYFLLDQADFMVHFMDISEEEMIKTVANIRPNKLESLLEVSLRITSANSDPYKDDLQVKLFNIDLKTMVMKIQSIETQNGISLNHFYN